MSGISHVGILFIYRTKVNLEVLRRTLQCSFLYTSSSTKPENRATLQNMEAPSQSAAR